MLEAKVASGFSSIKHFHEKLSNTIHKHHQSATGHNGAKFNSPRSRNRHHPTIELWCGIWVTLCWLYGHWRLPDFCSYWWKPLSRPTKTKLPEHRRLAVPDWRREWSVYRTHSRNALHTALPKAPATWFVETRKSLPVTEGHRPITWLENQGISYRSVLNSRGRGLFTNWF